MNHILQKLFYTVYCLTGGLCGDSVAKNPLANVGDASLIPGSGTSPGEESDNPLQYSHLGNPMERGVW